MSDTQEDPQQELDRLPLIGTLLTGAFISILNQTLLATATPHIMGEFNLSENTGQWLTTIFMLVNGVMIPVTAFLIETFTTRKLFMAAMSFFTVGTVICAIAPSFTVLIAGRVVQASGAGILIPLTMTVVFYVFPPNQRGTAMGMVGLVIAFAPAIGPTLSGWIVENWPWRTMFLIMLPVALIDMVIAYWALKNVTKQTYPRVDIPSIGLSIAGFGGLLYGFSAAGDVGWGSPRVLLALGIGAAALPAFILRQFRLRQPILEFRVFKYRTFTIATVIGMLIFMSLIGAETMLPIYMQNMAGFTALQSGMMIMPGAILMGIMNPIAGRIFDRIGARRLAIVGLTLVTATTLLYTRLTPDTSFAYMTIVFAVRMAGIAMVMMPVTTAGLNELSTDLVPHGTAMNNTMRQVSASIGTAILVTVMTMSALESGPDAAPMDRVHGVNVAFWVASGIAFAGLVLAFFLKPYRKRSPAPGDGVGEPAAEPSLSPAAGADPEPEPASTASAERSASALE
jgi:EmrB/QacA subfamily drug resistance transporter